MVQQPNQSFNVLKCFILLSIACLINAKEKKPNIIFVLADDVGWRSAFAELTEVDCQFLIFNVVLVILDTITKPHQFPHHSSILWLPEVCS